MKDLKNSPWRKDLKSSLTKAEQISLSDARVEILLAGCKTLGEPGSEQQAVFAGACLAGCGIVERITDSKQMAASRALSKQAPIVQT